MEMEIVRLLNAWSFDFWIFLAVFLSVIFITI